MKRLLTTAVLFGVVGLAGFAQATDSLIGTWTLNDSKSKGSSFKSGTTKVEAAGAGVKFTVDLDGSDGQVHWEFTANYDGKDNPVTGQNPYGDTVALIRIDARTTRITVKQAGKVTATQIIVVSEDGKTRTNTTKGRDAKGQAIESTAFYEKQ